MLISKSPLALLCLTCCLLFPIGKLRSEALPAISESNRVLTKELVKNFWINTLVNKPVPSKPSGLHPEKQAAWQQAVDDRNATIESVRNGHQDTAALLALHAHNAAAWRLNGNEAQALASEDELRKLREHLARIETLEIQQRAAQAQIDSAERLKRIEAELSALRVSCK